MKKNINFLQEKGVDVELTPVGDKYVARALAEQKLAVGGETSGHIIFADFANTGDGILSALQFLQFAKKSGLLVSQFARQWAKYPCQLRAIAVKEKPPLESLDGFLDEIYRLENSLGGKGRVYVRYSGTEPKLRILVEGADAAKVQQVADAAEAAYLQRTERKK